MSLYHPDVSETVALFDRMYADSVARTRAELRAKERLDIFHTPTPIIPRKSESIWTGDDGPGRPIPETNASRRAREQNRRRLEMALAAEATAALIESQEDAVARHEPHNAPRIGRMTITDLRAGQCRYPTSDEPFLFCGAATETSYCIAHAGICYRR